MKHIINLLKETSIHDFEKDPLYQWLKANDEYDHKRKLDAFLPILNFALTFPYYNRLYLTYSDAVKDTATLNLVHVINQHAETDAKHVHLLLKDIDDFKLSLLWDLKSPSEWLWTIWNSPTLEESRRILQQRVRSLLNQQSHHPAFRYLHIEQIELDGHWLFSALTALSKNLWGADLKPLYFGNPHLDLEDGHVGENEFLDIALSDDENTLAQQIIKEKHKLSLAMNKIMYEFSVSSATNIPAGILLREEQHNAIRSVKEKIKRYQQGQLAHLTWSISPRRDACDGELYDAWFKHHQQFIQHPLFGLLTETNEADCEKVLRATMLFFANRMLSLRSFNLYDLTLESDQVENSSLSVIRQMFSTHSALFYHDWHELNLDEEIQLSPSAFLEKLFVGDESEMIALHEFRREAICSATSSSLKVWCYLSINFMAAAFTKATSVLAHTYAKRFPHRAPLVYMQGLLHLLYEDINPNWNDPNLTQNLHSDLSAQEKEIAIKMMNRFAELGIKQWDYLYHFLTQENICGVFRSANAYLTDEESLPSSIKAMLYDEQVLHAKMLSYPWPEDASVFNGPLSTYYHPESRPKFPLPYYLIPAESVHHLECKSINKNINDQIFNDSHFKLFIHPHEKEYYRDHFSNRFKFISSDETEFFATPTSSYRSMLVWQPNNPAQPMFIAKLSLSKKMFGNSRLITKAEINQAIAIQRTFDELNTADNLIIYPEVLGVTSLEDIGGQIIREIPDNIINGSSRLIPFQALISPLHGELLLLNIINKSELSVIEFVRTYLIDYYLSMLEEITFKRGIQFQAHLQNLCLEVDVNMQPTGRFGMRDFSDMSFELFQSLQVGTFSDLWTSIAADHHIEVLGKYMEEFGYFYKQLVFNPVCSQLKIQEIDILSKEIDHRFLDLVKKYTGINVSYEDFVTDKSFPQCCVHFKKLGNRVARLGSKLMNLGQPILLTPVVQERLINQIRLGNWIDIGNCFPDGFENIHYLNAFFKLYKVYKVGNVIVAKDRQGEIVGMLFKGEVVSASVKQGGLFRAVG